MSKILKRTPGSGGTKILFCGCGLKYFSPLRVTNSKTTHNLLSFFPSQYPKRYRKSYCCGPFRPNTLRSTQAAFLIPKRYDELPRPHPGRMLLLPWLAWPQVKASKGSNENTASLKENSTDCEMNCLCWPVFTLYLMNC